MTLTASYEFCRRLNARHGRSYYLATLLLPAWKRPHVHALYGFARYADEIVDSFTMTGDRARALDDLTVKVTGALAGGTGGTGGTGDIGDIGDAAVDAAGDPVIPAFTQTVRSFGIEHGDVTAFLRSMRADLTVTRYSTYDDLLEYMEGSAAVIGTMMLPVLEPLPGLAGKAREPARQLGLAFQLTNFLRDVVEDLERGRVYLPLEDLDRFGVRVDDLGRATPTPALRELLAFETRRARDHYARAEEGIEMLTPSSRPCLRAAVALYGGILDRIEAARYDVLGARAAVPKRRRAAIFVRHLLAASAADRAERRVTVQVP
ncbi:phytoene/squalene synthase family protein [Streptosporangium sp. NPDC023615]|uniref:phytoene/squalene synthase family protein n=1 Tax=Streptosporangium sp. NPDC023615 TaxID=3154794 RepID=UPI003447E05A